MLNQEQVPPLNPSTFLPHEPPSRVPLPTVNATVFNDAGEETAAFLHRVVRRAVGRVFIVTAKGRLGLGVAGTKAGDVISLLGWRDYVRTSFAIRALTRDDFQLVGEAYVHCPHIETYERHSWTSINLF